MSLLTIRRLSSQDVATYREIRLHGLLHDPVAFTGCYDEESLWSDFAFAKRIGNPDDASAIFGAFTDKLVGVVGLHVPTAIKLRHKATLWGMYTLPSVRGMGAGRGLMAHLLAYARQYDFIERILLVVTASNTVASQWYDAVGFKLYAVEQKAVKIGDIYDDDELRVLELS